MARTLNLGILAHVDAGKTSLTERLLYTAGVIDEIGSVDAGSTQTDSLALEQQRGITIKSAVVSFVVDSSTGPVTVNLIDTPGHPDFIAEVERVLGVLDGAVLVVSAVEGVQAQTRVLLRTLRRLGIPTLIFINKIDRRGAQYEGVLRGIADKLTPAIVAMGTTHGLGTRSAGFVPYGGKDDAFTARLADVLADHDDEFLAAYVRDESAASYHQLRAGLAAQTGRARTHPVYFGSAVTGAGVDSLIAGIADLLPAAEGDRNGPVSGTVFKVERGPAGEKIGYVRMFSGTVRIRERLRFGPGTAGPGENGPSRAGKVTAVSVFDRGTAVPRASVAAGEIGLLWGLGDVKIGERVGDPDPDTVAEQHFFAPPTLETVVAPCRAADKGALHTALTQLAEQDPLINLRQDDHRQELHLSLYGEVQKEVIQTTLATEYGVVVEFRETTTLCVERPVSTGAAVELMKEESNPFRATIGLRVDPAPPGSGVEFRLGIDPRTAPTHIYKNLGGFTDAMRRYVLGTLREGIHGWQVVDCTVTMTRCGYSVADGPPSTRGPDSTAADFRKLTPLVVMSALVQARTQVCEPFHRFHLEMPADTLGAVLPVLPRLGAIPQTPHARGSSYVVEGEIPAARVYELQHQVVPLTRGEAMLESAFGAYHPVRGPVPTRARTDDNPLDRREYLLRTTRLRTSL